MKKYITLSFDKNFEIIVEDISFKGIIYFK